MAIIDGDMHAACILSRRLSSACRNVRMPSMCHRWGDIERNHLIYAGAQHSARACLKASRPHAVHTRADPTDPLLA
eukprot:3340361-Prymnesium_polylepis.1